MGEIVSPKNQHVLRPIHVHLFVEMVNPLSSIVICSLRVDKNTLFVVLAVDKRRRIIAIEVHVSKNLVYVNIFP